MACGATAAQSTVNRWVTGSNPVTPALIRRNMKKIIFSLKDKEYEGWAPEPISSIKNLPDWYKQTHPYSQRKFAIRNTNSLLTVKKCVPFLDAMSMGYQILLCADVYVDNFGTSDFLFNWSVKNTSIVATHDPMQVEKMPIPKRYNQGVFKWMNPWIIKTPKGYGSFITHPQNILDLPFHTFSGVVDTDKFDLPINFPFLIEKEFSGIIPKGTPIAQIIPFKRDDWKSSFSESISNLVNREQKYKSYVQNGYKKTDWVKKIFG